MAKRGKTGGEMDKPSSVSTSSMKVMHASNAKNMNDSGTPYKKAPSASLSMTKTHPLHEGKKSKNSYSAYKAN
jgi:hypothetical protein